MAYISSVLESVNTAEVTVAEMFTVPTLQGGRDLAGVC